MTPALRWAVMRAILMFRNCEGQSHKTVSTDHNFSRERRAEADSNRAPSAYQPNALPLRQTGSLREGIIIIYGAPSRKSPEHIQRHKDTLILTHTHTCITDGSVCKS